ncbi:unnamed protein product [Cuscuta europaea]|uniref:Ty3 transposon capsid-like protein domain-containing protein n=1 Tax=Cuscuta europaea TaxID=41803 RepID=A0A9P0Z8B3_CUSEU|nr:unnamed protein product [Cuscuta europaea]
MEDLKKTIEEIFNGVNLRVSKVEVEMSAKIEAMEAKLEQATERMNDAILRHTFPDDIRESFPRFNGSDPRCWIIKCLRFFRTCLRFNEQQKTVYASQHLEGQAEIWFQNFAKEDDEVMEWKGFVRAVLRRFDERDLFQDFKDLKQTSTLRRYVDEFEAIVPLALIILDGSTEKFLLECFICGLREEFRAKVRMVEPSDFQEAARVALLQEKTSLAMAG